MSKRALSSASHVSARSLQTSIWCIRGEASSRACTKHCTLQCKLAQHVAKKWCCLQDNILQPLHLMRSQKQPFTILDDVSGVLKPGRFTLLLGPPSAGKSTLLKALAGRLHHSADLQVCQEWPQLMLSALTLGQ